MKEQCDFPAFTAYRLEENILHIEIKKIKELSAKDVEQINDCHYKIGNGNKVYVLVTFQGFVPMNDEVIETAAKNRAQKIHGATAYVVDDSALRIGVRFFKIFHKPKYPIAIFGNKSEAVFWLRQEKKKNEKNISLLA